MISVLPPSRPATTLPAPPPPSLAELRAAARERLDAEPPPAKPAPEPGRDTVPCPPPSDEQPAETLGLLSSWGSAECWRRGGRS